MGGVYSLFKYIIIIRMVNTKRKMKGGSTELIKHIQDRIAEITRTMR